MHAWVGDRYDLMKIYIKKNNFGNRLFLPFLYVSRDQALHACVLYQP